jgi:hypothetical protein
MRSKLVPPGSDRERRVIWRERFLIDAGFPRATAHWLAPDMGFDLHALIELVDRGCPPELAVRIVAPLDWQEGVS